MPRAKDPIADLKAHRDRQAELAAREETLRTEAALFLGELMIRSELGGWEAKHLKALIGKAGKMGAEAALSALDGGATLRPGRLPPAGSSARATEPGGATHAE